MNEFLKQLFQRLGEIKTDKELVFQFSRYHEIELFWQICKILEQEKFQCELEGSSDMRVKMFEELERGVQFIEYEQAVKITTDMDPCLERMEQIRKENL